MDSNRVKYFITLAEQLHFGRAADLLFISQSSLSYHISELERELGVRLFTRNKRKVLLSSAGTQLLPIAKRLQQDLEELERAAAAAGASELALDKLCICFDSCFERFDLLGIPKSLADLRREYPELKITIAQRELPQLLAGTEHMEFDIGIGILRNEEKAGDLLNTLPLYEEPLALVYCDPDQDAPAGDLRKLLAENTMFLTRGDARWTDYITNYLASQHVTDPPVLMDNFMDILTHVYLGEGVTILPQTQYRAEALTRPGLRSIPLDDPMCHMRTCAFWAKGNYNYAITKMLSGIQISPEVSSLFW